MRRLVVALVVAAFAFALVGCGGGEKAATTTPTEGAEPAAAPKPAASTAAASKEATDTGLSTNVPAVFSQFPSDTVVPKEIVERITAKQPTLIYFYDATQNASVENRKIINSVLADNRGLVDLVAYDIGKHVTTEADQPVAVDKTFAKDAKYQQAVGLARLLGVSYTPYIVLTDGQGYITWEYRGLVDKDFLEREVLRASN